nr:hypothetical protein [Tanacetum cinerariifolium]
MIEHASEDDLHGSDNTTHSANLNAKFKIDDEFLKILRDNTFNEINKSDVINHMAKILEISEWIKTPNVDQNQLRLHIFLISLNGDAKEWWNNEIDGSRSSFTNIKWYQSLVIIFDQEKNNIQAQQKKKMVKSSSSLENEPCCSKSCKKNTDSLNSKITDLTDKLCDSKNMLFHYKAGLLQVEGLPEFADDTITDYTRPSSSVESNPDDLQNNSSSAFENEESTGSILSKPEIKKPSKKSTVKGNQRNWNNLKSQQLGVKKGRTCPMNTHKIIPPRPATHKSYRPPMRPIRPNVNNTRPKNTQDLIIILIQRVKRDKIRRLEEELSSEPNDDGRDSRTRIGKGTDQLSHRGTENTKSVRRDDGVHPDDNISAEAACDNLNSAILEDNDTKLH